MFAKDRCRCSKIAVRAWSVARVAASEFRLQNVRHYITVASSSSTLPCPETPVYTLRRGDSTVDVSIASGAIYRVRSAPGEGVAFDFLRPAPE
jgi:hypothetical protein